MVDVQLQETKVSEGRCVICKLGQLTAGRATMTFDDDDGLTVVIRHVPAIGVCDSCGEAYFDEDTARAMLAPGPAAEGTRCIHPGLRGLSRLALHKRSRPRSSS
jgi:YgiT-type zinc finger domain-containing protein